MGPHCQRSRACCVMRSVADGQRGRDTRRPGPLWTKLLRWTRGRTRARPAFRFRGSGKGSGGCSLASVAGNGPESTASDARGHVAAGARPHPGLLASRSGGIASGNPRTPHRQNGNSTRRLLSKVTKSLIHKHIRARLAQNAGRMNMRTWCDLQGVSPSSTGRVSGLASGRTNRSAMFRLCVCLNAAPAFGDGDRVSGNANVRNGVLKW